MTIEEAHIEFEVTVDKRATSQVPEMPPEVIDYFLNEAYSRFVKTRYAKNNIYKAGFEEIQKRTEDLKNLVVREAAVPTAVPYEEDEIAFPASRVVLDSLTIPYWFFLRATVQIKKGVCLPVWVSPKLVQQDDLERVLNDPFNRPTNGNPIIYFEDGSIVIRRDPSYIVQGMKLTYLKKFTPVNIGTYGPAVSQFEISEHTHKEIVQLAADIALENIESGRINSIKSQLSTIE